MSFPFKAAEVLLFYVFPSTSITVPRIGNRYLNMCFTGFHFIHQVFPLSILHGLVSACIPNFVGIPLWCFSMLSIFQSSLQLVFPVPTGKACILTYSLHKLHHPFFVNAYTVCLTNHGWKVFTFSLQKESTCLNALIMAFVWLLVCVDVWVLCVLSEACVYVSCGCMCFVCWAKFPSCAVCALQRGGRAV